MSGLGEIGGRWLDASGVAAQDWPVATLYVVALPIGNAADITLRALWLLSMADAVFAEDTRVTGTLLDRYGLRTPALAAAHEHNENAAAAAIVERLHAGQRVALASDAGTPAVCDPGARIVQAVRAAGFRVLPLPGAGCLLAALSASGLDASGFTFLGFAPTGARERERLLRAAATRGEAFALFEAPHRIEATAKTLAAVLAPGRHVIVARELTKKFESIEAVPAGRLVDWLAAQPTRGEYVLLVEGATPPAATSIDDGTRRWLAALAHVLPASKAAAVAARATGLKRELLYRELAHLHPKAQDEPEGES